MSLVAVVVYVGIIDRVGRRLPVNIVYTLITVILFIIGGLYYNKSRATGNTLVSFSLMALLTILAGHGVYLAAVLHSLYEIILGRRC